MPDDAQKREPREPPIRTAFRYLLCPFYVFAGVMHFVAPDAYASIVPPYLPAPHALVAISGVCEIAGGVGVLLPPPTRRWAGWGLFLLLLAVFPANVDMALRGGKEGLALGSKHVSPLVLWGRLPLQIPLLYWVYAAAIAPKKNADTGL